MSEEEIEKYCNKCRHRKEYQYYSFMTYYCASNNCLDLENIKSCKLIDINKLNRKLKKIKNG